MIEIKITDPHTMDKNALRQTAVFLMALAGDKLAMVAEKPTIVPIPTPPKDFVPPTPPIPPAPLLNTAPAPIVNPFANDPPAINPWANHAPLELPQMGVGIVPISPSVAPSIPAVPPSIPSVPTSAPSIAPIPHQVSGVELDVRGLPWDNRIHSRTKSKTREGHWKLMRGITPDNVTKVETELLQAASAPALQNVPIAPSVTPITPIAPPAPIDPIAPPQNDFPSLMMKITNAVNSNKITSAAVIKLVTDMGLPSVPVVATRPDLIPELINRLDALVNQAGA